MGNIEYEEKNYDFNWVGIAILMIGAPLIAYGIWISHDWIWLHEISSKITIWILNLLSGAENIVYFNDYDPTQPWIIHLPGTASDIHFETLCTGIHAIAIFVGAILCIPHSTDKETSKDIWKRKVIAMLVTSLVFYVVNIFRMVLQLYLYQRGADWDSVHYPISAASSFIAVACVLIMHKYVPEFIMSLIWIGDELKAMIKGKSTLEEDLDEIPSEISQEEDEIHAVSNSQINKEDESNDVDESDDVDESNVVDESDDVDKTENLEIQIDNQEGIKILREFEFFHGQIRFKIGFINNSDKVITDLEINFKIPEALKWIGHEPDFKRSGDSVKILKLNPEEKKVISLYLEPINCMEGDIRATISYLDSSNRLHTSVMKDKKINITCPIFFTPEDANLARVKNLFIDLTKTKKMLPLPSENLDKIFPLILTVIDSHDVQLISKDFLIDNQYGEATFYGVTKVKKQQMIIKAILDGRKQLIEIVVAGNKEDSITALLAELQNQLRDSFNEKGLIKNKSAFMEIKTSIILKICPYCGSKIKLESQNEYMSGENITCEWCKNLIINY